MLKHLFNYSLLILLFIFILIQYLPELILENIFNFSLTKNLFELEYYITLLALEGVYCTNMFI